MTSKGQLTIPKEVREALHLTPGDRVLFVVRPDGVAEMRPQSVDLRDCVGMLGSKGKHLTVEQMNEIVGRAASRRLR